MEIFSEKGTIEKTILESQYCLGLLRWKESTEELPAVHMEGEMLAVMSGGAGRKRGNSWRWNQRHAQCFGQRR